jgi:hypothetical protein
MHAGMTWIAPTIEYALQTPVDIAKLEKMFMDIADMPPGFRHRMMPFPPGMLLHEMFRAVAHHQLRRFWTEGKPQSKGFLAEDVEDHK